MDTTIPNVLGDEDDDPLILESPNTGGQCSTSRCRIPCRYIMVFMVSIGFFNAFALRTAFNMSLVAMVNFTQPSVINVTAIKCTREFHNTTIPEQSGEFNWSASLQSIMLGAFYYGYPLGQIPSGYIAERVGGRRIYAFIGFTGGILCLLMPLMASLHPIALIVVRALQGLCQAPIYPTLLALLSRWNPPGERVAMYAVSNSGATLGSVAGMALGGLLSQSTFLNGWPLPFYLFGTLSIIWAFTWLFLVYDTPATHPWISTEEREYIEQETEGLDEVKYTSPPWRSVFTSAPVIGIAILLLCDNFGFYVAFNSMPVYMKQVLGFDLSQDGLINALPYVVQLPTTYFVGFLADYIRKKNIIRLVNIRRIFVFIGESGPAICMIALGYSGCNKGVAIAMLSLGVSLNVFNLAGGTTSLFDIAPMYAGSIMGIVNGVANVGGFVSPAVVAAIAGDSSDQAKWRLAFFITAGVYIFGSLLYCFMIKDQEEPWATEKRAMRTGSMDSEYSEDTDDVPPLSLNT